MCKLDDPVVAVAGSRQGGPAVYESLGRMVRSLHDTLRELGFDKTIEGVVQSLPDARARLDYIARISGETAEKVIEQVEQAKQQQAVLSRQVDEVEARLIDDPVKAVASGTIHDFFESVRLHGSHTDSMLTEILTAQSFHDLTTQVVQRTIGLAQDLESKLLGLLLEMQSSQGCASAPAGELDGPVYKVETGSEVVTSQAQVDDLLESLGF